MSQCAKWLHELLSGGSAESTWVKEAAREAGFTKGELRAARSELDVKTWHQVDTTDEPRIDNWFWYLPGTQP